MTVRFRLHDLLLHILRLRECDESWQRQTQTHNRRRETVTETWPSALLLRHKPLELLRPAAEAILVSLCIPKAVLDLVCPLASETSPNPVTPPAAEVIPRAVGIREPARLRRSTYASRTSSSGPACPLLCGCMEVSGQRSTAVVSCASTCKSKVSTFCEVHCSSIAG